jgi:hypothetical protein
MYHNDHGDICHIMTTVTCVILAVVTYVTCLSYNDHSDMCQNVNSDTSHIYHMTPVISIIMSTVTCVTMTTVTQIQMSQRLLPYFQATVCPPSTPPYKPDALPQSDVLSCHEYVQIRGAGGLCALQTPLEGGAR